MEDKEMKEKVSGIEKETKEDLKSKMECEILNWIHVQKNIYWIIDKI